MHGIGRAAAKIFLRTAEAAKVIRQNEDLTKLGNLSRLIFRGRRVLNFTTDCSQVIVAAKLVWLVEKSQRLSHKLIRVDKG